MWHYVRLTRDGDSWVVRYGSEEAALEAVRKCNTADFEGDSPMMAVYLGAD